MFLFVYSSLIPQACSLHPFLSFCSGPSSSLTGQATPNPTPQPNQSVSKKNAEAVQHVSSKCPECPAQFRSKEEMAEHFQEIKPAQTSVSLYFFQTWFIGFYMNTQLCHQRYTFPLFKDIIESDNRYIAKHQNSLQVGLST